MELAVRISSFFFVVVKVAVWLLVKLIEYLQKSMTNDRDNAARTKEFDDGFWACEAQGNFCLQGICAQTNTQPNTHTDTHTPLLTVTVFLWVLNFIARI